MPFEAHKVQLLLHRMGLQVLHHTLLYPLAHVDSEEPAFEQMRHVSFGLVEGYPFHLCPVERDLPVRAILRDHRG
eukprot:CAMPEP_0181538808 /NCGR_PEP_ID=MMETSP1110-20121109/76056_1 /TAXON_ID=174948 /ORGANISM="Symbiodinium sp., Strain CCMP421" /LENGTH=74 /DNA_ID=CAMNT_0023670419 /DNA_START=390 /DNA_END=614 /DNA_ORIENTATION=+